MHYFDIEKTRRRIVAIKDELEAKLINCYDNDEIDYIEGVIETCEVMLNKIDKLL